MGLGFKVEDIFTVLETLVSRAVNLLLHELEFKLLT